MDTAPAFGFDELFGFIVDDIARALSEREGESGEQQRLRMQVTVYSIMSFLPRDVIEAYIAGHCVVLHEAMLAGVRESVRAAANPLRRAPRSNVVALNKAFNDGLELLQRHQLRPAEGRRDAATDAPATASATAVDAPAEAARASAAAEAQPAPPAPFVAAAEVNSAARAAQASGAAFTYSPSPEAVAECRANPEAMAALEAGDPGRFAKAMGIAVPAGAAVASGHSGGNWLPDQAAAGHTAGGTRATFDRVAADTPASRPAHAPVRPQDLKRHLAGSDTPDKSGV